MSMKNFEICFKNLPRVSDEGLLHCSCHHLNQSIKPGTYIVVIVVIIGNRKQVKAFSERNLTQLLQLICSLYA